MSTDLYGDSYTDNWEYARKIVTLGLKRPFYRVDSIVVGKKCSIAFFEENFGTFQPRYNEIDTAGLYAIYEKTSTSISCLYVGRTGYSMHQRVYRFMKELYGISRHDEDHPAAKKARKAGVEPNNIYVKFFPSSEFPKLNNVRIDYDTLDETCAVLLKSRFNKRKKV